MSKPVLAVGLLAVAAGAWYWALLPPALSPATRQRTVAEANAATPFPRVRLERLTEARRQPAPVARDPFRGAPAAPAVAAEARRPDGAARDAAAVDAAPAPPAWPRLDLIGLAEGRDGASLVRTAIVSGPRGVHHVRAGDTVEQVYRLERVATDGVDVRLLPEDRLIRLALRP